MGEKGGTTGFKDGSTILGDAPSAALQALLCKRFTQASHQSHAGMPAAAARERCGRRLRSPTGKNIKGGSGRIAAQASEL